MASKFTLGATERLKSRKQIDALFATGKSFNSSPFRLYYLVSNARQHPIQFGVGVSSKNFKKATDRNRIKRLLREVYRLQKIGFKETLSPSIQALDIFVIYTGREIPAYAEVYSKMEQSLLKLVNILSKQ